MYLFYYMFMALVNQKVYKSTCVPANQDNLVLEFYTKSVACHLSWTPINRLVNLYRQNIVRFFVWGLSIE